mgnify:CR=1 FL=1
MTSTKVDVVRAAVSKVMDLPLDVLAGSTPLNDIAVDSIARIVMVDAILQQQPTWTVPDHVIKYSKTIAEFASGIEIGTEENHG